MHLVVLAQSCAVEDTHKGEDDSVVTDLHIVLDIHEGEYLDIITELRLGRYYGFVTDVVHNSNLVFRH